MLICDLETGVKRPVVFMIDPETAANADAFANMAIQDIPKNHNRVRADAAYKAYMDYFSTNADRLDKVILRDLHTNPASNHDALGVGSYTPTTVIFSRKFNFGTKKWPDYRWIVCAVIGTVLYRLTSDNLLVTTYGDNHRIPISNLIAIVRP